MDVELRLQISEEEADAARKTPAVQEELRLSRDRVTTASAAAGRPVKDESWKELEKAGKQQRAEGAEQPTHHTGGAQHNR